LQLRIHGHFENLRFPYADGASVLITISLSPPYSHSPIMGISRIPNQKCD
jgi:hypothetical protein